MIDRRFRAVTVRSKLRRPLAAVTVGMFVAHCLSGGLALATTAHSIRRHKAKAPASEPAKAPSALELAAATGDPKAPSALEEVTINAQRTSDAVARLAQKEASNIIDIETYNTIKQLPDVTTAEAVERIPGISRETDEGEARYINIRGLDADLDSTTFDGVRLMPTNNASPFGGYRAVTLDSIPIGLVGAIEVTKSNLPSQDAEALGGTINITPKTAPPGGKPFLEGHVGGGYEPLRGTPIIDLQVSGGGRFGGQGTPAGGLSAYSDAPFSAVATLAYYEDKRGINDVEPSYIDAATRPDPLYSAINNMQQRDYELNRRRFGWGLDLGYQPDAEDKYYIRGFQAGYDERYWREFLNLTPDGNPTVDAAGRIVDTLNSPGAIQMGFRDEREINKEALYMAGGENIFDGGQTLDYRLAFTKGTWHKPYDYDSAFNYPTAANAIITYAPTGEGHTPLYTMSGAPGYLDAANYQLAGFGNSSAYNYDQEWSFASDFDLPVSWMAGNSEDLKLGVSARLRKKEETYFPSSYATLPSLSLTQASGGRPSESYYDGQYMNPPDILPGYLQSLLGPGTPAASDVLSGEQQYLKADENVYAAYAEYHVQWDRFGVVGGARVENTHDDLHAYQTGVDALGNQFANPVQTIHSYTNVFPGIQTRFQFRPDLIARATWSSTLARPGFNQVNPSAFIDLGSGNVTVGNPDLKPAYSNSFDADLEKYLPHAGIVSLGIFDKEIKDYIVADNTGSQVTFLNGTSTALKTYTFKNSSHSHARGVEFNYEQRLTFLPGLWNGLGVGANYTFVDSRFEIRPGQYSLLPSSSKDTWNASLFYERGGLTMRLAAYSVSADLFAIGSSPSGDVYNAKRTYLDWGSSYALAEHWQVYFNAQNLLNTPHVFWQGSPDRPIQREFYGQTYQAGFRFSY